MHETRGRPRTFFGMCLMLVKCACKAEATSKHDVGSAKESCWHLTCRALVLQYSVPSRVSKVRDCTDASHGDAPDGSV